MMQLPVDELTNPVYQADLKGSLSGPAIPGSSLSSLKVWLFDLNTGTILNGRDAAALSTGLVDSNGTLSWRMDVNDNAIIGTEEVEVHQAEFEVVTLGPPAVTFRHRVQFVVQNYHQVP